MTERTCCNVFYDRFRAESIGTTRVPAKPSYKSTAAATISASGIAHASKERYSRFVAELAVCPIKAASLPLATPARR